MQTKSYASIISAVRSAYWVIIPEKLQAIVDFLDLKAAGGMLTSEELEVAIGAARARGEKTIRGSVAVVPMLGVLSQRMDLMTDTSGGTSTERFVQDVESAMANDAVGAVVMDIDSPGGSAHGIQEASDRIHALRGKKPIVAVSNSSMASGAYWVGSAADEVVVSPGSLTGSIGVLAMHKDVSVAAEKEGVKYSIVSAGKHKVEGHPFSPLKDEARATIQRNVDEYYGQFVAAVARNRDAKKREIVKGFGEGRVVGVAEAVSSGLADRVATLDQVIGELVG